MEPKPINPPRRVNIQDAAGKKIASVLPGCRPDSDHGALMFVFDDNTCAVIHAAYGYSGQGDLDIRDDVGFSWDLEDVGFPLDHLKGAGVITPEQLKAHREAEHRRQQDRDKERRRLQYEYLKREFEPETNTDG